MMSGQFYFCGNTAVRPILYKSGTGYSLHQEPETPDNTIHWPNADVMLGHCLQRLASRAYHSNQNPLRSNHFIYLIMNINHEHIFYLNTS